jgi:hypothetical protein
MKGSNERKDPVLGVVLVDSDHYEAKTGRFEPTDTMGLGSLPPGWFESPATWPVTTEFAVATGATAKALMHTGSEVVEEVVDGLRNALSYLGPRCDLIVTDCGFFWGARSAVPAAQRSTVLLSGIDLLDLVAARSDQPIGLLTFAENSALRMLENHPARERLRLVGLSDMPTWNILNNDDFVLSGELDIDGLREDLIRRVSEELRAGELTDVGSLVLECAVLPQFLDDLHQLTAVPKFDVATLATAALGHSWPSLRERDPPQG